MKPGMSRDQTAATVINLVGLGIFAVAVLGGLVYFLLQGAHPLNDALSLVVVVLLVLAFNFAGRWVRNRPSL
jgi:hypothetical protein